MSQQPRGFVEYPFTRRMIYPAILPRCASGRDVQRHKVVIVGGGPVGLAVALGLAAHGVACVVLEADERVCSAAAPSAFPAQP